MRDETLDPSAPAIRDASRVDARQLPAVPSWVADPAKWVTLSRADRRALERHHRRQGKRK